jgi:hypothetical protein
MVQLLDARLLGQRVLSPVGALSRVLLVVLFAVSVSSCDADTPITSLHPDGAEHNNKGGGRTAVDKVTISPKPVTLNAIGQSSQLSAAALDRNGKRIANATFTWSSLNPAIATVDASGNVTSRAVGLALITAVSGGVADTARVDVRQVVASISVTPSSATISAGDTLRLVAVAADSNGVSIPAATFSWSSSDVGTATVSSSGTVTGVSRGESSIAVVAHEVSTRSAVTVGSTGTEETCSGHAYTRLVNVSTASQLSNALANAQPGDLIRLADGLYQGRFSTSRSGRAGTPIVICGSRAAVLETGSIIRGGFALVVQANHWIVDGFTVTNSLQGVRVLGGQHNVIRRLHVHSLGQEAINLKAFSSHNIVENNEIHDTGLTEPRYGEGVYVGTTQSQWCQWTDCQPDRSDSNVVRNNRIGPNIGSDMVDVKAGTTGTRIAGNIFDGRGSRDEQRAWVIVKGNDVVVEGNRGTLSPLHGFEVGSEEGWGQRAVFRNNHADLRGGAGYGIRIGSGGRETAIVRCDNVALGADKGLSNTACTP